MSIRGDRKGGAGGTEPGGFGGGEMGGEGVEDALMVGVEPREFLGQEHVDEDGDGVDGTEGERLELEELAEGRFSIGSDQQRVLYPDSELS